MQRLQRGEVGIVEVPFGHREDIQVAAVRPLVAEDRGASDINPAREAGESRVQREQVLIKRGPRRGRGPEILEVHLIDAVPLLVSQAAEAARAAAVRLASASVGDARSLDVADDSADAVLLLGPLYHLTSSLVPAGS